MHVKLIDYKHFLKDFNGSNRLKFLYINWEFN